MTNDRVRSQFSPRGVYLDTATYGLPNAATLDALEEALDKWRLGVATMGEYDSAVARSRELFADIARVKPRQVAVANQVSVFVGVIAASLTPGSSVVLGKGEFTSLLFPFLVNEVNGLEVRQVPPEDLAAAIEPNTDLVGFSAVHSSDGRVADIDAIDEAARLNSCQTLVDTTQATGWLPIEADRFDYTVTSAYKWLLCPRGTAFMTVREPADESLAPLLAGWYAGDEPWQSIYGGPLRLASDARRYDVSPAWLSWIGSVPALEMISDVGVDTIYRHNRRLVEVVEEHLGLPRSGSAIVTVPLRDSSILAELGIKTAVRSNAVRVGVHLYNNLEDVNALVKAVDTLSQA